MSIPPSPRSLSRRALLAACAVVPRGLPAAGPVEELWSYPAWWASPQAAALDALGRGMLFAAMKNGGVEVLELRPDGPPARIAGIGRRQLGGLDAMNLAQSGPLVFVALGDFFRAAGSPAGLAVVDVSEPRRPRVSGLWRSEDGLQGAAAVAVSGTMAYLAAMHHGVAVIDVANPSRPSQIARFLPDPQFPRRNPGRTARPNARGLFVAGDTLWVAFDAGGLRALDIAHPDQPREIGRYINPGMAAKQQAYNNVVIEGSRAYVAVDYAGMEVLDAGDPARIRQIGWWNPWDAHRLTNLWLNSPGHTNQIAFHPATRRVYLSAGAAELQVVDVSDPSRPERFAEFHAPGGDQGAWGVTLAEDTAFLSYIRASVPFRGVWPGIRAVRVL